MTGTLALGIAALIAAIQFAGSVAMILLFGGAICAGLLFAGWVMLP